jgi:NADH:ubiquinone oxidoreductase subunit 2 (subunit N)
LAPPQQSAVGLTLAKLASAAASPPLLSVATVLVAAGLGFKISAVPFHFYAPDVFEGATNGNAGLLAVAPKLGGLAALVRLLVVAMPDGSRLTWQILLVMAIATMTVGNICALWQTNLRRLMAFSSIAHAGYMLIGITVAAGAGGAGSGGISSAVLYRPWQVSGANWLCCPERFTWRRVRHRRVPVRRPGCGWPYWQLPAR